MQEQTIIITSKSNKQNILLDLSKNKQLLNLKFYTFSELKKKLFFDYNNKTLEYVMKEYNVSLKIAKIYLENLYFLQDLEDIKIKFLQDLKIKLEQQSLLILDKNFKEYLKSKKIVVYGQKDLTKEEKLILKDLEFEFQNKDIVSFKPLIYESKTITEEVEFVVNKVSELIAKGIEFNKIKLIFPENYTNLIKRYFTLFNIPINLNSTNSYFDTFIASDFLNAYDNVSILENITNLKEKYANIDELVTIVNKSHEIIDKSYRKSFIIEDLKNTKIREKSYDKAVLVADTSDNFSNNDYVFWLGFNLNTYPKVLKDDDFLSDIVKEKLEIDTSTEMNEFKKETMKESILAIKNLTITYKLSNGTETFYPSFLISELGVDIHSIELDSKTSYSLLNSKLDYAKNLDILNKYNIWNDKLTLYENNLKIPYRTYNNDYQEIKEELLRKFFENGLTISYTNLEMYQECAFKYYLSKVLNLDIYEENFKTVLGTIAHYVLEASDKKDIEVDKEIISFIKEKEYNLTAKEYFYLEKLSQELKEVIKEIKNQAQFSKLDSNFYEKELFIYKDKGDIQVTFKGLIDKIMCYNANSDKVLAVIDYKTGNPKVTLENLEYGLNMQLPIYLYLLKQSEEFKDYDVAGFYLQKIIHPIPKREFGKTLTEIRKEQLKLEGYSNNDWRILEFLDRDYSNSKILKGLRFKKDGELYSSTKVLNNNEMDDLVATIDKQIDTVIDNILTGNFTINPKIIKKENIACTYCKFKDICYKTKENEVILGGDDDELDRGTITSN